MFLLYCNSDQSDCNCAKNEISIQENETLPKCACGTILSKSVPTKSVTTYSQVLTLYCLHISIRTLALQLCLNIKN